MEPTLDRTLYTLLHDVARLTRVEADKRARVHGMTRAQWSLVGKLSRNPGMSQKELADLLEVEPISVARMVDRLEASGMLERRADASDRRVWRLHLLPAAEPMLEKMAGMADELWGFVSRGVPAEIREEMLRGLIQMKANLLRKPAAEPTETTRVEADRLTDRLARDTPEAVVPLEIA